MFMIKKILTPFLIPPGLFVSILIISGIWLFIRKYHKAGIFNVLIGIIIWIASIAPISEFMMRPLEAHFAIPQNPKGDVIIVMGGGAFDNVPDLSGIGFLSSDSMGRLVTAVRLQKITETPILISAGQTVPHKIPEALIAKRILIDLGVPRNKVIVEVKSRDTIENARFTKQLFQKSGFKSPMVVTSAYHMKRSILSFKKVGMDVDPYPTNFRTGKHRAYSWDDYLPGIRDLETFTIALREYIGLVFYQWMY
jgi:uncharacterized SAM-binding protein YcdF (DUF218 family)